ncbi:MAG: restriction endonuclease subunit S, partial [Synergistaceae bacterium]|nr:restriction endonuclease subunit S [Synergistaceae bacterium]
KDSGVEWIGKIPEEWGYGRIKYNYYLKGRIGWQGLKANEFIDNGPYLITGTDFENGSINWEKCYHISEERYNEAPEIHVKVGDLLITKDGTVGKVAFIDSKPDKVSLNSHLLIMRPINSQYSNKFLFWVIHSNIFDTFFQLSQNGSIMASLSQEKINNFSFPLPPLHEQIKISSYLDDKCSQIDSNINKREQIITKLTEYKKSLIYELVTGKQEL